ncbi:hypothetical protein Plhal304r1_c004g0016291 [Plasmopara halstedii]
MIDPYDARVDIWLEMYKLSWILYCRRFQQFPSRHPRPRFDVLDLHALQNGVDLINDVSSRALPRGPHMWIQTNKKLYTRVQFANLLKNGIGSTLRHRTTRTCLKVDTIITTDELLSLYEIIQIYNLVVVSSSSPNKFKTSGCIILGPCLSGCQILSSAKRGTL